MYLVFIRILECNKYYYNENFIAFYESKIEQICRQLCFDIEFEKIDIEISHNITKMIPIKKNFTMRVKYRSLRPI